MESHRHSEQDVSPAVSAEGGTTESPGRRGGAGTSGVPLGELRRARALLAESKEDFPAILATDRAFSPCDGRFLASEGWFSFVCLFCFVLFFVFRPRHAACGILVPDQGSNLCPLQRSSES